MIFLDPSIPVFAREIANSGQRIATALVYLNESYEEGATEFPRIALSYRGKGGDALLFMNVGPSGHPEPLSQHAGRTPRDGTKWVMSNFIRNRTTFHALRNEN